METQKINEITPTTEQRRTCTRGSGTEPFDYVKDFEEPYLQNSSDDHQFGSRVSQLELVPEVHEKTEEQVSFLKNGEVSAAGCGEVKSGQSIQKNSFEINHLSGQSNSNVETYLKTN